MALAIDGTESFTSRSTYFLKGFSGYFADRSENEAEPSANLFSEADGDLTETIGLLQERVSAGMGAILKRLAEQELLDRVIIIPVQVDLNYQASDVFNLDEADGDGLAELYVLSEVPNPQIVGVSQVYRLHIGKVEAIFPVEALTTEGVTSYPKLFVDRRDLQEIIAETRSSTQARLANMLLAIDEVVQIAIDVLIKEGSGNVVLRVGETEEP